MHCCASSKAEEEALILWTRDPFGRPQSHEKVSSAGRPTYRRYASTVQIGARSGEIGSSTIYRQFKRLQGRTLGISVPFRLWNVAASYAWPMNCGCSHERKHLSEHVQ